MSKVIKLAVPIVVVLAFVFLFVQKDKPLTDVQQPNFQDYNQVLSMLDKEIEMALKSGGINPNRYNEIDQMLLTLEGERYEPQRTQALRISLGKLAIGGQPKTSSTPTPRTATPAETAPPAIKTSSPTPNINTADNRPFWHYADGKMRWAREGSPPPCQEPLILGSPVDLNLVQGILYPGQVRGDGPEDFKPHGGFQLKAGNTSVELRAPMDGYLTSVAKFTDEFGLHYSLIFQHPCGIQFGGGHWGALPSDIQAIMGKIPLKAYGDSRTEEIIPPYFVKKGQIIVTGLQEKANPERPGFDWGVADYRQENEVSKNERFRDLYGAHPWNTYYGVCWIDLLPADQKPIVKSFPGVDMKSGKYSEYCE